MYDAIFFSSPTFPQIEMSCTPNFVVVLQEGHHEALWVSSLSSPPSPLSVTAPTEEENPIDSSIFQASNRAEDIAMVRNQGFSVDDDNEPVEENIPTAETPEARGSNLLPGQQWG